MVNHLKGAIISILAQAPFSTNTTAELAKLCSLSLVSFHVPLFSLSFSSVFSFPPALLEKLCEVYVFVA